MATFGDTAEAVGGASNGWGTGEMVFRKFTLAEAGDVESISAYLKSGPSSSPQAFRLALYADSSGTPGGLRGVTSEGAVLDTQTAYAWSTLSLPAPVSLSAGDYWLGVWLGDWYNSVDIAYGAASGGTGFWQGDVIYSSAGNPENPWVGGSGMTETLLFYATYTPASSAQDATIAAVLGPLSASATVANTTLAKELWTEGTTERMTWMASPDSPVTYEGEFSANGTFTDFVAVFSGVTVLYYDWTLPPDAVTSNTDTCALRIRARNPSNEVSAWEYSVAFWVLDANTSPRVSVNLGSIEAVATVGNVPLPRDATIACGLGALVLVATAANTPLARQDVTVFAMLGSVEVFVTVWNDSLPPQPTVSLPNGGETVTAGTPYNVTWTTNVAPTEGHFVVDLATPSGWVFLGKVNYVAGQTSYSFPWNVTQAVATDAYRIRIYYRNAAGNYLRFSLSDAAFSIGGSILQPTVTVPIRHPKCPRCYRRQRDRLFTRCWYCRWPL